MDTENRVSEKHPIVTVNIRVPEAFKWALQDIATERRRSLNMTVVMELEQLLRKNGYDLKTYKRIAQRKED